jgi:hypothetical protein
MVSLAPTVGAGIERPGGSSAAQPWLSSKALSTVLVLAAAVCVAVALVLLVGLNGWAYYRAPLATRGYMPQHGLLRPSGSVGLALGIAGVGSMLCTLPYFVRKRWKRLARVGSMRGWLETHIFFGIVGPVLITFHTAFKFNGLISVAYWMMVLVWSSGFVGRYLYLRIPKTIRGAEVSRADVEARLAAVAEQLAAIPHSCAAELAHLEHALMPARGRAPGALDLFFGELRARVRLALMRRRLRAAGVDLQATQQMVAMATERAALARRLAHLERARHLFELWHLFHRPLVVGLFTIVAVHVGVALFFGYARLAG